MSKKDFYQTLGVSKSATADEIKKSYRKLAMQYHPDKNQGNKKAEEKFKELSEAYEVLSDEKQRQVYDQYGHAGIGGNPYADGRGPGGGGNPFGGARAGATDSEGFHDIFGDIFGEIFGQAGGARAGGGRGSGRGDGFNARSGRQSARQSERGSDLRYTMHIALEEAALGSEKTISFLRQVGAREENAKLMVTVPAGVKDGQRLKLAGEGDRPASGIAGDLYVIVELQPHPIFKREDFDVVLDFPISYTKAILGSTLEIPTLTGKAEIKVPAGTHSGQVLRLKSKGFPRLGATGSGDMLVRLIVDTPEKISPRQKEIIEELNRQGDETPLVKNFNERLQTVLRNRK